MPDYRNKKYTAKIPAISRKPVGMPTAEGRNTLILKMANTFYAQIDGDTYAFTALEKNHTSSTEQDPISKRVISTKQDPISKNVILVSKISELRIAPETRLASPGGHPTSKAIRESQERGDTITFSVAVTFIISGNAKVSPPSTFVSSVMIITSNNVRTDCPPDVAAAMSTFAVSGYRLTASGI
jgi:hypothetical protein